MRARRSSPAARVAVSARPVGASRHPVSREVAVEVFADIVRVPAQALDLGLHLRELPAAPAGTAEGANPALGLPIEVFMVQTGAREQCVQGRALRVQRRFDGAAIVFGLRRSARRPRFDSLFDFFESLPHCVLLPLPGRFQVRLQVSALRPHLSPRVILAGPGEKGRGAGNGEQQYQEHDVHRQSGDDCDQAHGKEHVLNPPTGTGAAFLLRRFEPQAQCIPPHHQTVALLPRAFARAGKLLFHALASIERRFNLDRERGVDGSTPVGCTSKRDVAGNALYLELVAAIAQGDELVLPAAQLVETLALFGQCGLIQRLHGRSPSYSRTA